jgi:hypothetical protein
MKMRALCSQVPKKNSFFQDFFQKAVFGHFKNVQKSKPKKTFGKNSYKRENRS